MKPLVCSTLCLLASLCSLAHAEGIARVVKYSPTDIISIRAKVRFSTLVVLPAEEEILDFTTGDKDFWIINGSHNLCYLHPAQPGIRSNLNLITASGHVYSFLLTEISKESDSEPDLKVFVAASDQSSVSGTLNPIRYVRAGDLEAYKEEVLQLRNQAAQAQQHAEEAAARQTDEFKRSYPAKLEFDYRLDRKAWQAPFLVSAIYHDDRFTYIRTTAAEKPIIYEIRDNKANLINFDLENNVYVVPKIIERGYLVVGKKRLKFSRGGR